MMNRWMVWLALLFVVTPATAGAEEGQSSTLEARDSKIEEVQAAESAKDAQSRRPEFGLGARVGGYGFRDVQEGVLSWADCRMDGTGLYGTADVTKVFFGEFGADLYHSTGSSEGMDRLSFFPSVAAGARLFAGKIVTPYMLVGGGPEFTKITMDGVSTKHMLATAFWGVGGELNVKSFHFGTVIKVFAMGLPEHTHGTRQAHLESHEHAHEPSPRSASAIPAHDASDRNIVHEVAAQMQFSVRYTF